MLNSMGMPNYKIIDETDKYILHWQNSAYLTLVMAYMVASKNVCLKVIINFCFLSKRVNGQFYELTTVMDEYFQHGHAPELVSKPDLSFYADDALIGNAMAMLRASRASS